MERDPVCSMQVDPRKAAASTTYGGASYYFCSQDCADQFARQPELYAVKGGADPEEISGQL